jgi:transcriptional regulator with XRE-family HTH domain
MTISYDQIIKRLCSYRMSLNLTQQKMAPLLGIRQSQYSKMECGEALISYQSLMQMYQKKLDVDFIITGKTNSGSVINDYINECPEEKRPHFLHLIAWTLETELSQINNPEFQSLFPLIYYQVEISRMCMTSERNIWCAIRNVNNISQCAMAKGLQISLNRYRKIEKEKSYPDAEIFMQIYNLLGYPPSLILSEGRDCTNILNTFWNYLSLTNQRKIQSFLMNGLKYLTDKY